jgi:lipid-A-disaccharide synthase
MVVIFPFEEKIYKDAGVPVDFVGHPLVDIVRPTMTRSEFCARHGLDANRPILTLLPGSRRNEIAQHYGRIMEACAQLAEGPERIESIQFVHAAAPGLGPEFLADLGKGDAAHITRVEGATYDALAAADCAIVASGTATIEASLLGTPMVVIYRVTPASAFVLRRMIRTPFIGMVNLIAGKQVVPELVQDQFTSKGVVREVRRLLLSSEARQVMKVELAKVSAKLGPGGAIDRAADIFARML